MSECPRSRCTRPSEATAAKMALTIRKLGVYRVRPLRGGFDEWKRLVNVGLSRAREFVLVLASRAEMGAGTSTPDMRQVRLERFIWMR